MSGFPMWHSGGVRIFLHQFLSPLRYSSSSSFTVILISALSCSCLAGSAGTELLLVPDALDAGSLVSSSSVEEKQQPKELQLQQQNTRDAEKIEQMWNRHLCTI